MDKALTKQLMILNDIPTSPFVVFTEHEWKEDPERICAEIQERLTLPVFVKPVHLGSSIGVQKVENLIELKKAIDSALRVDIRILVENGIQGREIEFAAIGNDRIHVFPPGEICTGGKVYDDESKYGPEGAKAIPQTELPLK